MTVMRGNYDKARLRKLDATYDVHDRVAAMNHLQQRKAEGEIVTGLLYVQPDPKDLHRNLNTVSRPLKDLGDPELVPGSAALDKFNASLR